jgi:tetratricopeptide (TPR) repeat protein
MYARSMQGHRAEALQAAATLAESSRVMSKTMPEMADSFGAQPLFVRARFNDWATVFNTAEPEEEMVATRTAWTYVRTLALQARGSTAEAQRQRERFEQLRSKLPPDAPWGQNKAADVMRVASESLAARLAPNASQACAHWRRAVDIQDQFVYDEPPAWYYPVRESLGACLLQAGNTAEATKVFREGVRRSPRNGRMLFGLWQSLKLAGDNYEAETVRREFETSWSRADFALRLEDF